MTSTKLQIRIDTSEKERWQKESKKKGLTLSEYIRSRVNSEVVMTKPIVSTKPTKSVMTKFKDRDELEAEKIKRGHEEVLREETKARELFKSIMEKK